MSDEITWRAATREDQDAVLAHSGWIAERSKSGEILRLVAPEAKPIGLRLTAHEGTIRMQVTTWADNPAPIEVGEPISVPPQNYVEPLDELKPTDKTPPIEVKPDEASLRPLEKIEQEADLHKESAGEHAKHDPQQRHASKRK